MRTRVALVAGMLALALLSALGLTATQQGASAATSSSQPCTGVGSAPETWDNVVLIMFENKPLKKIIGNTTDAPYINSVAKACSYSKNTLSLSTTSLANYIALTSGYTGCGAATGAGACTQQQPITSNSDPATWPQPQLSLFELMNGAQAGSAVEWGQDRPSSCAVQSARSSGFTVSHTPFPYYTRTRAGVCQSSALPFPADATDVLSPKFSLVIPNKQNIMHLVPNTTIPQRIRNGDNWLKAYLPQLLDSPEYQQGKTVVLITWDEGNGSNYYVPLIAVSPYTTVGGVSSAAYDHYSTLKGIQEMVGAGPLLGHAADAGKSSVRDDGIFRIKP